MKIRDGIPSEMDCSGVGLSSFHCTWYRGGNGEERERIL